MIDTELKDLIRKAYKAGRRNALKQGEANLNDFINKYERKLKLFAIHVVIDTVYCENCLHFYPDTKTCIEYDKFKQQAGL